jgi:hypothetical protein
VHRQWRVFNSSICCHIATARCTRVRVFPTRYQQVNCSPEAANKAAVSRHRNTVKCM